MYTLYIHPWSPLCQKVMFLFNQCEIDHRLENIDLINAQNQSPEFKRMFSFGAVPALAHDDFCLAESNAILRYVANQENLFTVYPTQFKARAKVDEMVEFLCLHIGRWTTTLAYNLLLAPKIGRETNEKDVEEAHSELKRYLPLMEQRIGQNSRGIVGNVFTLADVVAAPFLHQFSMLELDLHEFPHTKAYSETLLKMPGWLKTLSFVTFDGPITKH